MSMIRFFRTEDRGTFAQLSRSRRRIVPVLSVTVLLILLSTSTLSAAVSFTSMVTFGDSLTDNQSVAVLLNTPPALYGTDPMEAVFKKGRNPTDRLKNFAVLGVSSAGLPAQITKYERALAAGTQPRATLISVEIGGNDFLDNSASLAAAPSGNNAAGDQVVTRLISNLRKSWLRLQTSHPAGQFVIWTIPDVTVTPAGLSMLNAQERANVRSHLARANRFILRLGKNPNTVVANLQTITLSLVNNPPLILGQRLNAPPLFGDFQDLFADEIHPTAIANALIANFIIKTMNRKLKDTIPLYTQSQLARLARI